MFVPGFTHQRRSVKLVALTLNDHLYFPTSAHSRLVGVDRLAAVPGGLDWGLGMV